MKPFYLDGSTPIKEWQGMVEVFQSGKGQVFLISLKAGGLGLNLTGANYVIHLDPWWNPAIEQQATDRAYRIGQSQKVTVYHLIAEHTIEEKILRRTKPSSRWRTRCSKERICRTNSLRKTSWSCWRRYNEDNNCKS